MIAYLAPDGSVTQRCGADPTDVVHPPQPLGRVKPPRFKVPIVAIRNGKARDIKAPRGRRVRVRSGYTVKVGSEYFRRANLSVRQGDTLHWLFSAASLHNVTVANGPFGFSSKNLSGDAEFTRKLKKPGTYQLFCALHPVTMTATIKVRPKRAARKYRETQTLRFEERATRDTRVTGLRGGPHTSWPRSLRWGPRLLRPVEHRSGLTSTGVPR
jgi:plastocyanin